MEISRKRFVETLASGSALLLFNGCGGGDSTTGSSNLGGGTMFGGGGTASSCSSDIANNHGHALPVSVTDLSSTTAKTYDITGAATHSHTVTLSVAQFGQLQQGVMVRVASSPAGDGHAHMVSVSCVIP